jgi:TRAP-type C4-dicarboxylate transport system substrate-binding protein
MHPLSIAQKEWCDLLKKESAQKMRCNILTKAVAAPPGTFDAVRDGMADIAFTVHGYTPGRFVLTQMAELPFLGDSAVPTSVAYQRAYERHLRALDEHHGVRVLAVFTHGPGILYNTQRAVQTLADAHGLKFRVGGGMVNDIASSLGLNVTLKPATEAFELLSTGIMDGALFTAESVKSFRLDMLRHATTFPGGLYNTSFAFLMNEAAYARLSAQDKAVLDRISGVQAARIFANAWDRADEQGKAYMRENMRGQAVQVTPASAQLVEEVRQRVAPVEQRWIKAAHAKGLKDPASVLAEFRADIAAQQRSATAAAR